MATVMSNLGFVQAMRAAGVGVRQTKVGDRYVLEAMKVSGFTLGGEQSGHVIMSRYATTGDGILTALHVLDRMAATSRSLAELAGVMTRLPQVLVNVPNVDKAPRRRGLRAGRGRGRGGGRARRLRAGAAAPVGHRAAGPRDGRGEAPPSRRRRSPTGWPPSSANSWLSPEARGSAQAFQTGATRLR